jgi:hypothetical protein
MSNGANGTRSLVPFLAEPPMSRGGINDQSTEWVTAWRLSAQATGQDEAHKALALD